MTAQQEIDDDDSAPIQPGEVARAKRTIAAFRTVKVTFLSILVGGALVAGYSEIERRLAHAAAEEEVAAARGEALDLYRRADDPRVHRGLQGSVVVIRGDAFLVVNGQVIAQARPQ